jgi:RNA polymerase sigma-70 factor (ECF subfamily)
LFDRSQFVAGAIMSPVDATSEELLASSRTGDEAAMDQLLERHLPGLRNFLRLRCGPRVRAMESVSDLAQSVCREALQELDDFDYRGEAAFRAWLFRLAERRVVDRVRYYEREKRDVRRVQPLQAGADSSQRDIAGSYATFLTPSRVAMSHEDVERLESAFDELPERYRDVIVWSRIVGLSNEDIGRELDCTPHYARTLLSRGLARLAALLGPDFA